MHSTISVRNLSKIYDGGFQALKNINLEIQRGEIFALLGPNGAGKTTLISIVCGLVNPGEGQVLADGHDIITDFRAARAKIGLVPQELTTDSFETVWNTIGFSRGLFGKPANPAHLEAVLRELSLWDKRNTRIMKLSGGMKQRVEVARALAVSPDVIYMDEPFGALDSLTRLSMRSELLRIWQEHKQTILFVTHDVDESIQLADRIVVFSDRPGRIEEIVEVDLPHPRDLGSPEYGVIKNRLYERLGVSHTV